MKRRTTFLVAALFAVALLASTIAIGDWWSGESRQSASDEQVVMSGKRDGRGWQVVASRSPGCGIRIAIKATNPDRQERTLGCLAFVGIARSATSSTSPQPQITLLAAAATEELPALIVGAAIAEASSVEIRLNDGQSLLVPTVAGRGPLQGTRFYATQLPYSPSPGFLDDLSVAAQDPTGTTVACLVPRTAVNGVSALADCR